MPDPVDDLLALAGSPISPPPKPPPPKQPPPKPSPPLSLRKVAPAQQKATVVPQPSSSDPLAEAGKEISGCYQLIEDAWKKAEAKLAIAHVPIEVRTQCSQSDDGWDRTYLAYTRHKGEWRICVIYSRLIPQTGDDDETCRLVTECPVEQRLEMFDHFADLHAAVLKTTQDFVPKVADRVTKFLASLESLDR